MSGNVPRSPFTWCPDCAGKGVIADATGRLIPCAHCGGQGRLKVPGETATRVRRPRTAAAAGTAPKAAAVARHTPRARTAGAAEPAAAAPSAPLPATAPRPTPHEYFMGFARHAATRSKDTTKVGAALVGPQGEVRLTGYNGPPMGVKDTPDRFERPRKYLFSSHAEQNVIAFAARQGIRTADCTLYVTHHPCSSCARSIIQAGIVAVMVGGHGFEGEWSEEIAAARLMFADAGVEVRED